jgi:hypothetical protein
MISVNAVALELSGEAGAGAVWALAAPAVTINANALVANKALKKDEPPPARPTPLILLPPIFR